MSRALLLRHGQSTWNAQSRWQGWADPPLSDAGREQARVAAAGLRDAHVDAAVASDLLRAQETAGIMADALGLGAVETEPDLRERDVGAWSGLTTDEIEARWPGQLASWRAGTLAVLPEGEGDITDRVMAGLRRVLLSHPGGTVLVVTHGGVIRTIERHLGLDPKPVRNMGGRWVSLAGGADESGDESGDGAGATVVAGEAVRLQDPDAPAATTTVL